MLVALANRTTIEVNAKDAADDWLDQTIVAKGLELADRTPRK